MAIFHGRGVSATERKTRLTESERRKRRKLMCVVTAFSVVFLYAFAWLWSGLVAVGFANIDLLWPRLASDPFPFFSLDEETLSGCLCWGAIGFLIPWVYYSMWVRKQGNYDPGAEHGDSRLAIAEDFSDITDAELPSNNLKFTTHAWMAVCPRGKELARAMTALNLNALVIGTSGGGKTSSYAKPLIAASMGTRLCPGGVGPSGIADEGFDLVFTDTKGDVLPDVGHALVNSGADVRCFNVRDPENSDKCNPFASVNTAYVDAVNPHGAPVVCTASVDGEKLSLGVKEGKPCEELSVAIDGETITRAGAAPAPSEDWLCPVCHAPMPAEASLCADPDCTGRRPLTADAALAVSFGANSFASGDVRGVALRVRLRNRDLAARSVRIECVLPHGMRYTSSHLCGTDEEAGELLLTPEGLPCLRWDVEAEAGAVLALDAVALVDKVCEISGSMLTRICSCIVSNLNATEDGAKEDPFWSRCATTLFQGDAGLLLQAWGKKECTLPGVMDLVLSQQVDPADVGKDAVDLMMEAWETGYLPKTSGKAGWGVSNATQVPCDVRDLSPIEVLDDGYWKPKPDQRWFGPHKRSEDPALSAYFTYRKGAVETRQSVLITSAATLSSLMSPTMRRLLSEDTLNLDALGSGNGSHVLSIISHDQDKTYKPLIALVFFLTLMRLDENATKLPGARLPRPVHILADEFKNLGKLPEIDGALATVRSKNVSVSMCVQSIDQLDGTYGEHVAAELRDNCATIVFMGGSNEKTLKSFETLSGTETIDMIQTSRSFGTSGQTTESRQAVQRPVVSVGQLRTCPPTHAYVLMKGKNAFKDWKTGFGAYDFYEWFDPAREDRGCSKGKRKFTEYFDFARYKADRDAGRVPYDFDERLKAMPAAWVPADEGKEG